MPIENIIKRRVARELQEWIYLGIEDGMLMAAREYKMLIAAGRTAEADKIIKYAVDIPFQALARVEAMETQYTTKYLDECLALYGDCTLQELKDAITTKQKYAMEQALLVIDAKTDNVTVADSITSSVSSNSEQWIAPVPATYKDICTVEAEKATVEAEAVK